MDRIESEIIGEGETQRQHGDLICLFLLFQNNTQQPRQSPNDHLQDNTGILDISYRHKYGGAREENNGF
jgi:hypothetical protein